jgi:DNA-binding response OmpR family regulator
MNTKLIILVEDDLNLRQSIVLILERAGYCVDATDCPYKAMDILQSGNYQLIISDFNMPVAKKVLLPKALDIYPNLSIVILTDQSLSEIDREGKQLKAQYLLKPIAPERLLDCVGMILGESGNSTHENLNVLPINHN